MHTLLIANKFLTDLNKNSLINNLHEDRNSMVVRALDFRFCLIIKIKNRHPNALLTK